ncbi:MAG: hydantoinase/oxoprolinase family protein [Actinobacteria bacterium]|nr:hydantoinase/oxoprolinase family protein [Actinomycetota bacterium]
MLAAALADRYDAVAVCLLNAYLDPGHERRVASLVREIAPALHVVTSSEVAPEWREYERWSTTLVSAYVAPTIADYLGRLDARLTAGGLSTPLHVMQSNGGVTTARTAVDRAVQTLFSGPVGGTMACVAVGRELDEPRLVCVDMGGTSFDVSLVVDGEPEIESQIEIEGHPVLIASVGMHSLGAGGGSLARVETGGLRVGPESAGSHPGPACYGKGGERPTVTDANVILGRIPPDARLAGTMPIDAAAGERALALVAGELGISVPVLAEGIVGVADAMMADAIREVTVARGIDPREFSLLAFGGAGPLHAVSLATELGIRRVVVPREPGALSAWGMLHADIRHDLVRAVFGRIGAIGVSVLAAALAALRSEATALLIAEGVGAEHVALEPSADLRYLGQEYTLTVPIAEPLNDESVAALAPAFAEAHLKRYGHNNPGEQVEIVNLRLAAIGRRPRPPRAPLVERPAPEPRSVVQTVFAGTAVACSVFARDEIGLGVAVHGPAIVLEDGCTTLLPAGWHASASPHGHLLLERTEGA